MSNYEKLVWLALVSTGAYAFTIGSFLIALMPGPNASPNTIGWGAWFAIVWTLVFGFAWLLRRVYLLGKGVQ